MIAEIAEKSGDQQYFLLSTALCALVLVACKLAASYIQYRLSTNSDSYKKFNKENNQTSNGKPPTLNLDFKQD